MCGCELPSSLTSARKLDIGLDTEAVLLDAGLEWDEIGALRERGGLG